MVEHCISTFAKKKKELIYQTYITDSLKLIAENTAKKVGGNSLKVRFAEILESMYNNDKEEDASEVAEQIITDIRNKLRG